MNVIIPEKAGCHLVPSISDRQVQIPGRLVNKIEEYNRRLMRQGRRRSGW